MRANIQIIKTTEDHVVIQDIGPWDRFPTVTNDAENVIRYLWNNKLINDNQQLFYYDSDNQLDELVFEKDQFKGFKPCNVNIDY